MDYCKTNTGRKKIIGERKWERKLFFVLSTGFSKLFQGETNDCVLSQKPKKRERMKAIHIIQKAERKKCAPWIIEFFQKKLQMGNTNRELGKEKPQNR